MECVTRFVTVPGWDGGRESGENEILGLNTVAADAFVTGSLAHPAGSFSCESKTTHEPICTQQNETKTTAVGCGGKRHLKTKPA